MIVTVLVIAVTWVYLLATAITSVLTDVVAVAGLLAALFYILTAAAMIAYYRRRVLATAWDFLAVGVLPASAAGFLGWVAYRSLQAAPAPERWTIAAIITSGLTLMLIARFGLRSPFFAIAREADQPSRPAHANGRPR